MVFGFLSMTIGHLSLIILTPPVLDTLRAVPGLEPAASRRLPLPLYAPRLPQSRVEGYSPEKPREALRLTVRAELRLQVARRLLLLVLVLLCLACKPRPSR